MQILTGQIVFYKSNPAITGKTAIHHIPDGAIAINKEGLIDWVGNKSDIPDRYTSWQTIDYGDQLIMPGFVDAHLHFPQHRMLAAFGKDLLDWLNKYTFIEEQRYGDKTVAKLAAGQFVDELLRNGITTCLAFSTIHPIALDMLFEEASSRKMAMASGKTLMDCNAPSRLCDTAQSAYDDTTALIKKWHGKDRLQYAISPRFAVTSSTAQLEATATLVKENPDLLIQTHLSENHSEIEFVAKAFPWSKDYTDVYEHYGLLTPKARFAHGIHLSQREIERLSEASSAIIHCPTSNNFLGSGLFALHKTSTGGFPVTVGVGCDIGGGMSYSMFETLKDAYCVSQLVGSRISAHEAFYMATLGNARLLGYDSTQGTIEAGKYADLVILNPQATPIMQRRHELSQDLHDILFALIILGDDRVISETYVAGQACKPKMHQSF